MFRKWLICLFIIIALGNLNKFASEPIKTEFERKEKEKFRNVIKNSKIKKITAVKYEIVDRKETGKKYKIIEQEFDSNGNLIVLKTYDKGNLAQTIKFYYDDNFNLIEEEEFSKENNLVKKTVYNYKEGRIQSQEIYDKNKSLVETYKFNYSQDKKLITVKKFKEGKYLEYSLDYIFRQDYDKEKETEIFRYSDDGKLTMRTENQYDAKGNLLETIIYDAKNIIQSDTNYQYDEKGNNIKITLFNKEKAVQYYDEFKYNQKNICEEIKRFYTPERMLTKIVHEFEYFE